MPGKNGALVEEITCSFPWSPGFAKVQKRKNIWALHEAARSYGIERILEISSKSEDKVGQRLSAFNLKLKVNGVARYLESVYQASKVFEKCGPSPQILDMGPREAKRFVRNLDCGRLISFSFEQENYPLSPKNAFYDWLYIRSLAEHSDWIKKLASYEAYSDIEFNPKRQVNCQARAFAEFMSLLEKSEVDRVTADFSYFAKMLPAI